MRALGIALLLTTLLTACSSDSDEPAASTSPSSPTADLKAAVKAYSDAYLTGDGAGAYALLSKRCKDRETEADFSAIVDQAAEQYGEALPFKSFDADISGDLARVTYTYAVAEINQDAEPWTLEGGKWHEDDC